MYKWAIALFALSALLVACKPAVSTSSPSPSPQITETSTQAPAQTILPLPSQALTPTHAPTLAPTALPATASSLALEHVSQLGGSISGITIVGDVAYVGIGPRLAAIDISHPEAPRLIIQSEPLPGMVTRLLQVPSGPNPLLLVNAGKYLVLVNTSNPDELSPLHQLELPGAISAMLWDYRVSTLYAGGSIYQAPYKYAGFITAVDLTLDHRLQIIASVSIPSWPACLALGEDSLFLGLQGDAGGLYRIQVNSPTALSTPQLLIGSSPARSIQPTSLQVIGETLLLGNMTIEAYDITHPDQPMQIWSQYVGMVVKSFNLDGDQVYIFSWSPAGTYLPAVATITLPQPIKGSPAGESASFTTMHNGHFLVAYHDLEIYHDVNSQGLQLIGRYQPPVTNIFGAAANDSEVFVVDYGVGDGLTNAILRVLSLPDLTPLGQVTTEIPTSSHQFHGIALESDRLYLCTEDGVWVYDVKGDEPSLMGQPVIPGGQVNALTALKLGGQRILVVSQSESDLSVLTAYDLTDLATPIKIGSPLTLDRGLILQMTLDGSALYAVLTSIYEPDSEFLYVVEVEDNGLSLRQYLTIPKYIFSQAVADGVIAVTGTSGLSIISAAEPGSFQIVSQTALPEVGQAVAIVKDQALVIAENEFGAAQLLGFDIRDPANPNQVMALDISIGDNPLSSLMTAGPYVVIVNGDGGVEVLQAMFSSTCLDAQAQPQKVPPRQQPLEVRFISDGNIWLWQEGASAHQISNTGDALRFTFSPDGQVVAFERLAGDYPWGQFKISLWAVDRDGSHLRELVSAELFDAFLPGREDAWVANVPTDYRWFVGTHELTFGVYAHINAVGAGQAAEGYWIVSTDNGALKQWDHPDSIDPYGPRKIVSPDGKIIALVDRESISLQKSDGSFIRQDALTYEANSNLEGYGWGPPAVVWSPDSQALKVVVWDKDAYFDSFSVWVIPADGRPAEKLHTFQGIQYFSSISPDQEHIAYLRRPDPLVNNNELHLARFDGSQDIIYTKGYQLEFLGWAPDSYHFAYDEFSIYQPLLGSLCGKPVRLVNSSETPATQITWVDATHFIFVVGQVGEPRQLRLGQVGGESLLIGPFNGQSSVYEGQWTYFQVRQAGQEVIAP